MNHVDESRQYTPLEDFTDLRSEVHGLSNRFDSFAIETNEKFTVLNHANTELRRGQSQQTELLIELKNRNAGMDLKGLLSAGMGLLVTISVSVGLFAATVSGVLYLSSVNAASASKAVEQRIDERLDDIEKQAIKDNAKQDLERERLKYEERKR